MHKSILLYSFAISGLSFGTSALDQPGCGMGKINNSDFWRDYLRITGGSEAKYKYKLIRCLGKIIVHPMYIAETNQNDIALIKMRKQIPLGDRSPYVAICVPGLQDYFYDKLMAAGWGHKTTKPGESYASKLFRVPLVRVSQKKCYSLVGNTFQDTYMCTFDDEHKKGVWEGDSGGLAMCLHEKSNVLYVCGVASMAHPDGLVVYVEVESYFHWIEETVTRFSNTIDKA